MIANILFWLFVVLGLASAACYVIGFCMLVINAILKCVLYWWKS